jgi:peptidase M28-like protein
VRKCDGATARKGHGAMMRRRDGLPRRSGIAEAGATLRAAFGSTVLACVLFACAAETLGPPVQNATLKFDSGRAYEDLRRQVGFGPRPAGSAALAQCRQYILAQLKAAGIEVREDAWDAETPLGRVRMVNLVATIPGRRADRIALATHYDTKLFREFRFVGASDGASSTAAVLELGRILKSRQNDYTIELLFFDGEEAVVEWYRNNDNTYGSRHYVESARKAGTLDGLKALVLLDMIGDRNLTIRRDMNSTRWLTDTVWASAMKLGYRTSFLQDETTIDDDHIPFLKAGVAAVDIIDLDYPAWHTAQDDLDRVSARSLQIVGDVVLDALPQIEKRLASAR